MSCGSTICLLSSEVQIDHLPARSAPHDHGGVGRRATGERVTCSCSRPLRRRLTSRMPGCSTTTRWCCTFRFAISAPRSSLRSQNVVDDVDHVMKANTSIHLAEQRTGSRSWVTGASRRDHERTPGRRSRQSDHLLAVRDGDTRRGGRQVGVPTRRSPAARTCACPTSSMRSSGDYRVETATLGS